MGEVVTTDVVCTTARAYGLSCRVHQVESYCWSFLSVSSASATGSSRYYVLSMTHFAVKFAASYDSRAHWVVEELVFKDSHASSQVAAFFPHLESWRTLSS